MNLRRDGYRKTSTMKIKEELMNELKEKLHPSISRLGVDKLAKIDYKEYLLIEGWLSFAIDDLLRAAKKDGKLEGVELTLSKLEEVLEHGTDPKRIQYIIEDVKELVFD